MSLDELDEARQQLRTYALSKDLDTGLSDVSFIFTFSCGGKHSFDHDGLSSDYESRINHDGRKAARMAVHSRTIRQ